MPSKFLADQFSNPRGLSGYVVGRLMNHGNARINRFAAQQLDLQRSDRVLEIGFGGGVMLPTLIAGASWVAGLDRSPDVVKLANRQFAKAVEQDRAEFREGSVEAIPYGSGYFTKATTVNTVYFWKDLDQAFLEIYRVLAIGGRVTVGFLPKKWMDPMGFPKNIFTSRTADEVAVSLLKAGFDGVRTALPERAAGWNVIVAERR